MPFQRSIFALLNAVWSSNRIRRCSGSSIPMTLLPIAAFNAGP